jgi:hypothetical protein
MAGILLLIGCAWVYGQVGMETSGGTVPADAAKRAFTEMNRQGAGMDSAEQLSKFYGLLPARGARTELLERIYAAAALHNISLDQGDYRPIRTADGKVGLFEIVLPVKGSYIQIRKFVAQALLDVPTLALDSISLSRQKITEPTLDAELRFTLYMEKT